MTFIHTYFKAEKYASLFFVILGATFILGTFYFWLAVNLPFFNGLGWPVLFVAFLQFFAGLFIYFRTSTDLNLVLNFASKHPKNIKNMEMPRMAIVLARFKLYHKVEIALCLFGLIVFLMGASEGFLRGFGLGIVVQSGIMLIANSFAELRGKHYLFSLKTHFK